MGPHCMRTIVNERAANEMEMERKREWERAKWKKNEMRRENHRVLERVLHGQNFLEKRKQINTLYWNVFFPHTPYLSSFLLVLSFYFASCSWNYFTSCGVDDWKFSEVSGVSADRCNLFVSFFISLGNIIMSHDPWLYLRRSDYYTYTFCH